MQVGIFVGVQWIDFQPHDAEVFARQRAGLADVGNGGHRTAFACQKQDFLQSGRGDRLHLTLNLLRVQLRAADFVVAVEAAVDAVVFAVIRDIQRGKQLNPVAEMLAGFLLRALRDLL